MSTAARTALWNISLEGKKLVSAGMNLDIQVLGVMKHISSDLSDMNECIKKILFSWRWVKAQPFQQKNSDGVWDYKSRQSTVRL